MSRIFRHILTALALISFSASASFIGDTNGDGMVNITDLNDLIDMILRGQYSSEYDLNNDGSLNISDVNDLIERIVNGIFEERVERLVGGDISMLTTFEAHQRQAWATGAKYAYYRDQNGQRIDDVITWVKQQGWNAARVRLFVNPENASSTAKREGVLQNLDSVKVLGRRIKEAGMKFMLDFHYSDTWADPLAQTTPDAWATLDDDALVQQVYEYTRDCLRELKAAGAEPEYIQTGNEISYGMLWGPAGTPQSQLKQCFSTSSEANWSRFARLLTAAGQACREECPQAKIILHTERVPRTSTLVGFYNQMKNRGVDYDIIGLSYYPYFHGLMSVLNTALRAVTNSFPDKDVMIVETGYSYKYAMGDIDCTATWPLTSAGQRQFTIDLIAQLKGYDSVKGLFWWYPEANEYGLGSLQVNAGWYNAGLWDHTTGRAMPALQEMKEFI